MKKTVMTCLTALILLSGCSETAAVQIDEITETAETETADRENDHAGKTVTGQVTAVSGNTVKIQSGKMVYDTGMMNGYMEQEKADGRLVSGQTPEKPDGKYDADFPGNITEGIFVPKGDLFTIEAETELSPGEYIEIVFAPDGSVERISSAEILPVTEEDSDAGNQD